MKLELLGYFFYTIYYTRQTYRVTDAFIHSTSLFETKQKNKVIACWTDSPRISLRDFWYTFAFVHKSQLVSRWKK